MDFHEKKIKWQKRDNRVSRKELREKLDRYSRQPFIDALTQFMQARPTGDSVFAWANEHPDKWANAVSIMAKLSGFKEQIEIEHTFIDPTQMSDAELLQRLGQLRDKLSASELVAPGVVQNLNAPVEPMLTIEHDPQAKKMGAEAPILDQE